MKKYKFFLAAVLFITCALAFASHAHASTQVADDIPTDTEWTADQSPYVLTKQIQVKSGVTLTIDAGVTVTYNGDFYVYPKEAGILVLGGTVAIGNASGERVHMNAVSLQAESKSTITITNADIRGIVANSATLDLKSMTIKSIWLMGSKATMTGSSLVGDASYGSLVSGNSTLTLQDGTITNINPSLNSLDIGATGTVNLTNVTVRSLSTGILMKGFALLITHNVLIENCPTDGIQMKKIDPGFHSYDNHVYLVNTEIAGNGTGIEASDWPYFEMAGDSIHDNGTGFKYTGKAPFTVSVMHMQNNWWGDASGPYNETSNANGKGNAIANLTLFSPWLSAVPFPSTYVKDAGSTVTATADTTSTDTTSAGGTGSTESMVDTSTTSGTTTDTTAVTQIETDTQTQGDTQTQTQVETQDVAVVSDTTKTAARPLERAPVLIVPGVLGTEIIDGSGNKLWLDISRTLTDIGDGFMDALQFKTNLTPSDPSLKPSDVVRTVVGPGGLGRFDYVQGLLDTFRQAGYVEGKDIFLFPYDWRYGVSENIVTQLKQKISEILSKTGSTAVDVVAHSMGGLIVKKYASENSSSTGISKAVFVGVPNMGAPKAIKALLQGDSFGVPFLADGEMRKIAKNMPAIYDLIPSSKYYTDVGSYFQLAERSFLSSVKSNLSFDQFTERIKNKYDLNAQAVAQAVDLHSSAFDRYDLGSSGIDSYSIAGCKTGTIGTIAEVDSQDVLGKPTRDFIVSGEVSGDGTVPLSSAKSLRVSDDHAYYALKAEHAEMLSQDGVKQEIVNILSGSTFAVDEGLVARTTAQCHLNGRLLSIFSPLAISVTDSEGNHAGISSDGVSVENSIPNADYEMFGDHTFVYLPTDEGQTYSIQLVGIGDGTFTLTDASIVNDEVTGTQTFADVPVTSQLKGALVIGSTDMLTVDSDGDGSPDTTPTPTHVTVKSKPTVSSAHAALNLKAVRSLAAEVSQDTANIGGPLWIGILIGSIVLSLLLIKILTKK